MTSLSRKFNSVIAFQRQSIYLFADPTNLEENTMKSVIIHMYIQIKKDRLIKSPTKTVKTKDIHINLKIGKYVFFFRYQIPSGKTIGTKIKVSQKLNKSL